MGAGLTNKERKKYDKEIGGCLTAIILFPFKAIWFIITLPWQIAKKSKN